MVGRASPTAGTQKGAQVQQVQRRDEEEKEEEEERRVGSEEAVGAEAVGQQQRAARAVRGGGELPGGGSYRNLSHWAVHDGCPLHPRLVQTPPHIECVYSL